MVDQKQLEAMVEQALEIFILFDETGRIEYANQKTMEINLKIRSFAENTRVQAVRWCVRLEKCIVVAPFPVK
mgnify:CR=1 FL=1